MAERDKREARADGIEVRECVGIDEFEACIALQHEVFGFPDVEISPRRHFIVTRWAGGWVLGAFDCGRLVGFVHHLQAVHGEEVSGYSHMMAVSPAYQNCGIGARLKWAQRERALAEGRRVIRWTWDPMQTRNAHFNLNRLGVIVRSYENNFYGTDYGVRASAGVTLPGIDSDRLYALWELDAERVVARAAKRPPQPFAEEPAAFVEIPPDWAGLKRETSARARLEQLRVRAAFAEAFARGLVCAGFERDAAHPRYLLYREV